MKPSIGLTNLPKFIIACFGSEICSLLMQEIHTDFDYRYIHVTKFKRLFPV